MQRIDPEQYWQTDASEEKRYIHNLEGNRESNEMWGFHLLPRGEDDFSRILRESSLFDLRAERISQ